MPEIRELLHDAAPTPRAYDEDAIRSRVATRRRHRRMLAGAAAVLALALVGGVAAVVGQDDPDQTVVAQPAPEGGKQAGITAVAHVGDEVWTGDEAGRVGPKDGAEVLSASGPVRLLVAGDVLWAAGDTWVAAIDPVDGTDLGRWDAGGGVADIQPLEGEHVAVSLPDDGTIAIVRVSAEGLEELSRIEVVGRPTNLVLTSGGDLWVNDGDVICRIDWGAGGAVDEQSWAGALLAPSADGGVWAVDGDRVVDLHPELLTQGQSVALGARYDFVGATLAAATPTALYVGGEGGIVRFDRNDQLPMPVTDDVPTAMSVSGETLVYVSRGQLGALGVGMAEPDDSPEAVAESYLRETYGWSDVVVDDAVVEETAEGEHWRTVKARSPRLGRDAQIGLREMGHGWSVWWVGTRLDGEPADDGASVSLGNGADSVYYSYSEAGLTPELTVHYGDSETVLTGEPGGAAQWEGDLGFVPDTEGWIQVLFRDADGLVLEGWRTPLPAGPFAAG